MRALCLLVLAVSMLMSTLIEFSCNCVIVVCAVVDNLPIVPEEKFEKLSGVVKKVISQAHGIIREGRGYDGRSSAGGNLLTGVLMDFVLVWS